MIKNCDNIIGKNLILPKSKIEIMKWNLYKRRVPMKNLFQDYDKLKKSKITRVRFKSLLNNYDIRFSEKELETMCDAYKIDDEFVDYIKLCNEIELIRNSEQEKKIIRQKCGNKMIYKPNEENEVNFILKEIATEIYLKRLSLKDNFKDFDHLNSGHISKTQFFRILHKIMNIDIKKDKEDLLIRRYLDRDNNREMNYFKFLKDIKNIINRREGKENLENENSVNENFILEKKEDLNVNDVLKKINRDCRLYGKDIRYFFKDYDKLRKNNCNVPKFEHCLSILDFKLNKNELEILVNNYKFTENCYDLIDYKKFIDDLKKLNYNPKNLSENNQSFKEIKNYFYQIKHIQKTKNFMFKQFCQDFDKNSKGEVTVSQFKRILNNYELLSQNPKETEKLINFFKKTNNKIDYISFLKKLNEISVENCKNPNLVDKFQTQNFCSIKNFEKENLDGLFKKMVRIEKIRKTIFNYHLKNYDNLNCGFISTSSFFSGIGVSGLILSFEDMNLLKFFYEDTEKMNYKLFLQEYKIYKKLNFTNSDKIEINQESNELDDVMKEIKFFLDSRRIDLKMYFKNWDSFNRFKIPKNKFLQVISLLNININKKEVDLILKKFENNDDNLLFDYKIFLDSLNLNENQVYNTYSQEEFEKVSEEIVNCESKRDDAFELLITKLITQRIGLKNYFQDYDVLSKGYIKQDEFISVLDKIANISKIKNFQLIPKKYLLKENFIDYIQFLKDVKCYSKSQNFIKSKIKEFTLFDLNKLTEKEKIELEEILENIKEHNRNHRLLWKTYFKDEDRSNRGLVFKDKVRSLLDRLGIKFTDRGFNLLSKGFSRNKIEFDYLQFIRIIDFN